MRAATPLSALPCLVFSFCYVGIATERGRQRPIRVVVSRLREKGGRLCAAKNCSAISVCRPKNDPDAVRPKPG
jgi:hypothetical protein